ncbi:MAG: ferritin-like domain-containing protein [Cyclobacteriaceae bacterium]
MSKPKFNSFQDLFLHELKDLYSVESQLIEALPKMAEAATDPQLKHAFESHLEETKGQKERLEKVSSILDESLKGEDCDAMKGLIKEGKEAIKAKGDDDLRDAALIASAQRVEHYEIAAYGTATRFAKLVGQTEIAGLLASTLEEEKEADSKLNEIATASVNRKAGTVH